MACEKKELEPGDDKMGTSQHYGALLGQYQHIRRLTVLQRTVKFINEDASSIHGSLKVGSVYTSESGEWKLGGFDVLSSVKDDESIIYVRILRLATRLEADEPNRHTVAWYQTLDDMRPPNLPGAAGTSSRRTLTQQWTHSISAH